MTVTHKKTFTMVYTENWIYLHPVLWHLSVSRCESGLLWRVWDGKERLGVRTDWVKDRLLSSLPSGSVRLAFESTAVCLSPLSLILTHVHTFYMHESYSRLCRHARSGAVRSSTRQHVVGWGGGMSR